MSLEVHEHLIATCLCGCAVVKKCNWLVGSRLALSCLGLGNSLLASASWVDSACLLATWASASFFLLASASWVDSACLLATWASASLFLLPSASWVDSACRLAAWASASFFLFASAFWVDSACRFIQHYRISLCMPRLHRIKIMDTHQIHEYPDSTVLTVLKWRMITTLNRKLLEKQRV